MAVPAHLRQTTPMHRCPEPSRRHVELIEFAKRLTVTIDALGYTKAAFARSVGATPGQLHHWCLGANFPSVDVLIEMDRVHGLSTDWLLRGRLSGLPHDVAQKIQSTYKERENRLPRHR